MIGRKSALALALLALAGCQSSGGGATAPAPAPGATPPAMAAAPAATGSKTDICTAEAAKRYGVQGEALSLSNEYPTETGDAIDGAATQADGFKRFKCDFSRDGAFTGISDLPADS
jgi:hypothetical protein